jgi:hypothetical protein
MVQELLNFWPYAIGFGFALIVGQIFIGQISVSMYTELGIRNRERAWQSVLLGWIERILFIASLQLGIHEFIAVWLGVKTAGGWKHWSEEYWEHTNSDGRKIKVLGRHTFNIFLLNQALSIGFAGVGWKLIVWLNQCAWEKAIAIGVSTLIGSTILLIIVKQRCNKPKDISPNN